MHGYIYAHPCTCTPTSTHNSIFCFKRIARLAQHRLQAVLLPRTMHTKAAVVPTPTVVYTRRVAEREIHYSHFLSRSSKVNILEPEPSRSK